jgi:CRP-like cAMP-binding protein
LEPVELERRKHLERPQKPIEYLYFPGNGIVSVVTANDPSAQIEIGVIGREGGTGLAVIMGSASSPHSTFVQAPGNALCIAVKELLGACEQSESLRTLLLRYAHVFMVQTANTAAANAKGTIEERLARWLLMAQDRMDNDNLPLTHEFLAVMLGSRRPGVTDALHELAKDGLIRKDRGIIVIVNRGGLLKRAGKLYGEPEAEYKRQFG